MVPTRPPITSPTGLLTKNLGTVPIATIIIGITITFIFHSSFSFLAKSKYIFHFWLSFHFSFSSQLGWQRSLISRFSYFVVNHPLGWVRGRDLVICLILKIPENFVRLLLQDGFWFVHIRFGSIIEFQFLQVFHTSQCWWSFTAVWVSKSLHASRSQHSCEF